VASRRPCRPRTSVAAATINGITAASFQGQPAGARIPDVVGNIRYEAPWGVAQLSAAAHQNSASLFGSSALGTPATTPALPLTPGYAFPAATSNNYGFAVQAGLQFKMDFLSPGDRFWLQAAYEKGAFGYIAGNNLGFNYGAINQNRSAGSGFTPEDYSFGWNPQAGSDCVFAANNPIFASGISCQQASGWDITAAYKHYWLPNLASGVYGSYMQFYNPQNALDGFGGAVGVSNKQEGRVGTNLVWTPIKGFDIGAEFMFIHVTRSRPVGLASNAQLNAVGLPSFQANQDEYTGRIRIQRAF
jgi:hypothetical protein